MHIIVLTQSDTSLNKICNGIYWTKDLTGLSATKYQCPKSTATKAPPKKTNELSTQGQENKAKIKLLTVRGKIREPWS